MSKNQQRTMSRRSLLLNSICMLAGIAIISTKGKNALAAENKLAKSAVQYEDIAKSKGKDCDDCVHFIPGKSTKAMGSCKIVEGEINPHGHCIAFTAKAMRF